MTGELEMLGFGVATFRQIASEFRQAATLRRSSEAPLRSRGACLLVLLAVICCSLPAATIAQSQLPPAEPPERMQSLSGNFIGQTDRPLRYFPDGQDFVITNGVEFFNRPLYGGNTAFRVDGGDKPEFSLYLPGRGGNLRLGIKTSAGMKWLNDAAHIVTRYRSGALLYELSDPLLGKGRVRLAVEMSREMEAVLLRTELDSTDLPVELLWGFGGANGMRGRRGGDIGCEREPIREFFQLRPEQCRDDRIETSGEAFVLTGARSVIYGVATGGAVHRVADAELWNSPEALFESASERFTLSLVTGRVALSRDDPVYLALQVRQENQRDLRADELVKRFSVAERERKKIADRVIVETPDPFVNAAAAALNIAGDGVWDERQGAFMHGAVAWRTRLLGWRAAYTGDALGWHERTRRHLAGYAKEQITDPVPDEIPEPEASANLSRNETALHSNGDMTRKHYDMNLVAVDAFFRHLLWTGDLDFAREYWPVLKRHLAWERRLFRREYGPDKLPLYEGYACFWASDDVAYNGGGAALSSAYNYYHNKMTARLANILGEDPAPYEMEAELISRAMHKELWLSDRGWFAEYKDWLGLQVAHPSPGVWSIYHTIDSEVPSPEEAWRMTQFVETELPHIPISGPNVPPGCFTIPTSRWMPYAWSVNNLVMAEVMHTSLACWQANRRELAFPMFKGALLDSMFLGLCPGNVGMCTFFDAYRHESQRDFSDGTGATSRALVEGLFGIKPDALAGVLTIRPGFPADWDYANIRHPDLNVSFKRDGTRETFVIEQKFGKPMKLRLRVPALRDEIEGATVNGVAVRGRKMSEIVGNPVVEIEAETAANTKIIVNWTGGEPVDIVPAPERHGTTVPSPWEEGQGEGQQGVGEPGRFWKGHVSPTQLEPVNLTGAFNDKVTQIFRNEYLSPRSPFCSLATPKQGIGSWCLPNTTFDVDDSGLRVLAAKNGGKFSLPNGVVFATPAEPAVRNIAFVSQWDNYPNEISVPLNGKSSHAYLLMAGSTGPMQSRIDNGEAIVTYVDGSTDRLALHNPTTWWPIDQDYFIDDYAFRFDGPLPPRVDLKTGRVRVLDMEMFKGRGGEVTGGAATVLHLPLDPEKELRSLTVRALANEVVIGLMSLSLAR